MPAISMFYGVVICLYFFDNERHRLPHIHAKYQGSDELKLLDSHFILDLQLALG
jgi:hypothetical protein